MQITDAMVDAAADKLAALDDPFSWLSNKDQNELMRAALSAALPEQTLPVRVEAGDIVNDEKLTLEVSAFLLERDQQTTQDERDEAERETSAFMISQMVARHIRSALVDVPAVEPEPVATGWNLVKGLENGSLALGDDMKPYRAHPPRSALVNAQADADVVERWQPIETAPLNEEVFLGWFDMDGDWVTEVGEGSWGWRNETANNMSSHGSATHWRPIPAPPALRSSGSAEVGSATNTKENSDA